jgi:hypothetical protein
MPVDLVEELDNSRGMQGLAEKLEEAPKAWKEVGGVPSAEEVNLWVADLRKLLSKQREENEHAPC